MIIFEMPTLFMQTLDFFISEFLIKVNKYEIRKHMWQ